MQLQMLSTIKRGDDWGTALVCLLPELSPLSVILPDQEPGQAQVHLMPTWPLELSFMAVRHNEMSGHYSPTLNEQHITCPHDLPLSCCLELGFALAIWESFRQNRQLVGKLGFCLGTPSFSWVTCCQNRQLVGKLGFFLGNPALVWEPWRQNRQLVGKLGFCLGRIFMKNM